MKKILAALAMLCVAPIGLLPASAEQVHPQTMVTTDVTDIYFVASEPGWGMQANQSGNFVFITLFVYDAGGQPRWFTANLTQTSGLSFSGPIYQNTGPYYGGPFNPALVTQTQVGTFTFTLDTILTGHITYNVGPVNVAKSIQRQPLLLEPITGTYTGSGNITATSCTTPGNNGFLNAGFTIVVNQVGSAVNGTFQFAGGGACSYSGTYSELGRMSTISSNFFCPNGDTGTMNFIEVTNRIGILSGRLSGASTVTACNYSGRWAGVNPNVP